jgi:hypothetical protein
MVQLVLHAMSFAPREKLPNGLSVRRARVPVPDRRREELDEAPGGALTGAADRSRQIFESGARELPRRDWDKLPAHGRNASKPRRR